MLRVLLALVVLVPPALVAPATFASHQTGECDLPPVGRCGAFDREVVHACYVVVNGLIGFATERNVVPIGDARATHPAAPSTPVDGHLPGAVAYVHRDAVDSFTDDAPGEDWPVLFLESNDVDGLQLRPFRCAQFQWWWELWAWMGPFNGDNQHRLPDDYVL